MRKSAAVTLLAVVSLLVFTGAKRRAAAPPPLLAIPTLNEQRSFEITDLAILQNFPFQRVLDQLVVRSGVNGMTSAQLYRQWFDTQNPKPGLADASAPHCDDFMVDGKPAFNGIPRRCPTSEGALANAPYASTEYFPLALVNRFDLTPPDGSNCGQYRMVYARKAATRPEKLHIIFEATLPNPHPEQGLLGCRDVALFWANLSGDASMTSRRAKLEQFFFDGIPGYAPAVDPANFDGRMNQSGVRTLHFGSTVFQRFYQFRLVKNCSSGSCTLRMVPDVLENVPYGQYFDSQDTSDTARAFRDDFVGQVASLANENADLFEMHVPTRYLMVESNPLDDVNADNSFTFWTNGLKTAEGLAFKARIDAELQRVGSSRTAEDILLRAALRGCNGCHVGVTPGLAGQSDSALRQRFPTNFGDQFFDEAQSFTGPDGERFRPGSAVFFFMPHRQQILRDFLLYGTPPVHSN